MLLESHAFEGSQALPRTSTNVIAKKIKMIAHSRNRFPIEGRLELSAMYLPSVNEGRPPAGATTHADALNS